MQYNTNGNYDIYDIVYKNDATVKDILEKDFLYSQTGFIALQDVYGNLWFFHKKAGAFIPAKQEHLERTYSKRDTLPKMGKFKSEKDECEYTFPNAEYAKELFTSLNKISACADWKIERRLWKLISTSPVLYDGPARMVRPEDYMDRVTILKCIQALDKTTKRRNFTNFSRWKYLNSHEMTSDGKITILSESAPAVASPKPVSDVSPKEDIPAASSKKDNYSKALSREALAGIFSALRSAPKSEPISDTKPDVQNPVALEPEIPEVPNIPNVPEVPDIPEVPNIPDVPDIPKIPDIPDVPEVPDILEVPNIPEVSDIPEIPDIPDVPEVPDIPDVPNIPEVPDIPDVPDVPDIPDIPDIPDVPDIPAIPETALPPLDMPEVAPPIPELLPPMSEQIPPAPACPEPAQVIFTDKAGLLNCDKRKCRLESYDENILYDIKRGHWDLYNCVVNSEDPDASKWIPRDPKKDIKKGIVGIDFGTKSTVVVRQDDTNAIVPIRIGAGMLSAAIRESDYENPTIIECANLEKFLSDYYTEPGRPETSFEDFFVSYDAFNDYRSCTPNEFYAYYAGLKQWANHEKENVQVLDKQGHKYHLGTFSSEKDKVINPIELYAYYIGMHINNMRNGIYMKYLMSFPVGYPTETRQLIVTSFEKGIRKSLPSCILEDEACMKEFSVQLGISEPAAYAVTALEMSELEPEDENDKYRYGIFDFGGGTTDFGFGIWRGASEEEYEIEGYDYVLECFGADSDVTLGGENILELLSYAVFKKNRDLARKLRLTCSLPVGEMAFLGSEALISNSQIAQRNMTILKEELRPLWHQEENWKEKYQHETGEYIELSMYDIDGQIQPSCRFEIDTQELISLIKARIQKGIDAFFQCMSKTFQNKKASLDGDGQMYIFLAGNSSRSVFVTELFEAAIQERSEQLSETDGTGISCYRLVEPLNATNETREEYVPNAKTSVAYGLIKSREGSSIKVERNLETDAGRQTRFKYYLGRERRHRFDCRLSPATTEYGTWVRFQGAARQTVRIYYTTDPVADVKDAAPVIDNIPYKEITISPQEGAFLFIRTCEPTVMEYMVALSEEEIGTYNKICRIDFGA